MDEGWIEVSEKKGRDILCRIVFFAFYQLLLLRVVFFDAV